MVDEEEGTWKERVSLWLEVVRVWWGERERECCVVMSEDRGREREWCREWQKEEMSR